MTKFNFQTENDVDALWRKEEQQDQKAQFTGKVARERERERGRKKKLMRF